MMKSVKPFVDTCLVLAALAVVAVFAGCGKDERETKPAVKPSSRQVTLTYQVEGDGSLEGTGTQILGPGASGSAVTAVPAEGHHFVAWSDGVTTAKRLDQDLTGDLTLTARFSPNQYLLTYAAADHGSISGEVQQTVNHGGAGSEVTAVPDNGYRFAGWSDGVATASRTDADVRSDLVVTANFDLDRYKLVYVAEGKGRVEGDTSQVVAFGASASPVTAVPDKFHHFVAWSDGVTSAKRIDREVKTDLTVTAKFAIDQYSLSYSAGEHGSIEGPGSQKIAHGGNGGKVTAVPAAGYHFVSWSDGGKSASREDTKLLGDMAVTATFAINQYTLNYQAGEHGRIDGPSPQTVDHGGSGEAVTAVADRGYHFVSWSDGVTNARRVDAQIKGGLTAKAEFAVNTYAVGGKLSGLVQGTQVVLQNNGGDDLTLSADGDFNFASELLHARPYDVQVTTHPTSPNQVCSVDKGAGTIDEADVTDIRVTCVLKTYSIGGTLTGLPEGDQVVLKNNGRDDLTVKADGTFTFAALLDDGSPYLVEVAKFPKKLNWTCEVNNGAGTLAGQDIGDVTVDCFPKVVLQASAGVRKVKLTWNPQDFSKVIFNLCRASEEIPAGAFQNCETLAEAAGQKNVTQPLTISPLINDVPYWFQVEAAYESGRRTLSEVVKAMPFGGLNDSGIDWCASGIDNVAADRGRAEKTAGCNSLAGSFPDQDAVFGRDAQARERKLKKDGNGAAGFDFTKLCRSGEAAGAGRCPPNPVPGEGLKSWGCTRDNVTGLTWEVKTESGLQAKGNTYSWYYPDAEFNGGELGTPRGGKCQGSECDTQDYVKKVNETGLCGITTWRVPTKEELLSIIDNSSFKPAVDLRYFPNTMSDYYWSSSLYADNGASAWQVLFGSGEAYADEKKQGRHLRLVSGSTVTFGLENP